MVRYGGAVGLGRWYAKWVRWDGTLVRLAWYGQDGMLVRVMDVWILDDDIID